MAKNKKKFVRNGATSEPAILVTGGSGFIGKPLVSKLASDNQAVVCMYHHRLPEPQANVFPVCSDMGSAELIAAPLRGVHTVIHLAWEGSFIGPDEPVSWHMQSTNLPKNVRLLKNLIDAMERAQTRRIIFVSALGACRTAPTPFLQEKYLAEFLILNSKIPEKIILRSSVVYGDGGVNDKFLRSIVRVMQFPGVYPVPHARQIIAPVHIDYIADSLASIASAKLEQPVSIFELIGRQSYSLDEVFRMVSERYVRKPKLALRGFLANSLLPLFERDSKNDPQAIRFSHYLSSVEASSGSSIHESPLKQLIPEDTHNLKDALSMST